MDITHVRLKNWRNFRSVDVPLSDTTYILGANASGKSNFLDVFRFLRDITKQDGGGLQKAIQDRGGISKLKCLHARQSQVSIEVGAKSTDGVEWRYFLEFQSEGKGAHRTLVSREEVHRNNAPVLLRPSPADTKDITRLTQTSLEQIQANAEFRDLANFFSETTYLHLVPQLLKHRQQIGGQVLEDDPFGQGFLERIAKAQPRTRISRLSKIQKALQIAVPQFAELEFESDKISGRPHLRARFQHFRPNAGWQREEHFSDGTLRLLGLLWSLLEGSSLLLMEEPELSLNSSIISQIPAMMYNIQRAAKKKRQILISTHSDALLSNKAIDPTGVLLVCPGKNGSTIRQPNEVEVNALKDGFSVAEVILPSANPIAAEQLSLSLQ